jgi:hypothetical protein
MRSFVLFARPEALPDSREIYSELASTGDISSTWEKSGDELLSDTQ